MYLFGILVSVYCSFHGTALAGVTCPPNAAQRNALINEANQEMRRSATLLAGHQFAEAEPLVRRELAILTACLGPQSPDVGSRLIDLGQIRFERARDNNLLSAAEQQREYRRAIELVERGIDLIVGREQPDYIGKAWCELGYMKSIQGDSIDAFALFTRATTLLSQHGESEDLGRCVQDIWDSMPRMIEVLPERSLSSMELKAMLEVLYADLDQDHVDHQWKVKGILQLSSWALTSKDSGAALVYYERAVHAELGDNCTSHIGDLLWQLSALQGEALRDDVSRECRDLLKQVATVRPDARFELLARTGVRDLCGMQTFEDVTGFAVPAEMWFSWKFSNIGRDRSSAALAEALVFAEENEIAMHPVVVELLDSVIASAREDDGEPRLRQAVTFAEKHGIWSVEVQRVYLQDAYALAEAGQLRDAWRRFQRVRHHIDPSAGSPMLRHDLNELSVAFNRAHKDPHAIVAGELALEMARAGNEDNYVIARMQRNLAILYRNVRRIPEASRLDEDAAERELGMLRPLAEEYASSGSLRLAERTLLYALERLEGRDNVLLMASTQDRLAQIEVRIGDLDSARLNIEQADDLRSLKFASGDPSRAETQLSLAMLELARGERSLAESHLQKGIAMLRPYPGTAPNTFVQLLTLEGGMQTRGSDAERLYNEALGVGETYLSPTDPVLIEPLYRLARMAEQRGDLKETIALLERSHAIGAYHPLAALDLMASEVERARLLMSRGSTDQASAEARRLVGIAISIMGKSSLTEREARAAQLRSRSSIDLALSVGAHAPAEETWALVLRWKGQVSDLFTSSSHPSEPEKADADKRPQTNAHFLSRSANATGLVLRGGQEHLHMALRADEYNELVDRIHADIQETPVLPREICASLRPDAVLVDIFKYRSFDFSLLGTEPGWRYVAFIVKSQRCADVAMVDLGPAESIDAATQSYNALLADSGSTSVAIDAAGRVLAGLVWTPLAGYLSGFGELLLAPDGELAALSWGALPVAPAHYLIEDFTIRYLENARDLVRAQLAGPVDVPVSQGLLLVGNIDYSSPGSETPSAEESSRAACLAGSFSPLAGTLDEINVIEEVFRRSSLADEGMVRLEGSSATELVAAGELPRHRFVHIATHGFYPDERCLSAASFSQSAHERQDWARAYNPMALSGIAMAGASGYHLNPLDDGRLTASELAGLDLRGVETVVLSACGSALGLSSAGDGLLGIGHALRQGGVRNLVMTTAPVSDRLTVDLMRRFYVHLLARPDVDPAEALRAAQLETLSEARYRFRSGRPQAWAAFIVSGPPPLVPAPAGAAP